MIEFNLNSVQTKSLFQTGIKKKCTPYKYHTNIVPVSHQYHANIIPKSNEKK